jgi:hypothetical protein
MHHTLICHKIAKKKLILFPLHAMEALGGKGGIILHILNLGTR